MKITFRNFLELPPGEPEDVLANQIAVSRRDGIMTVRIPTDEKDVLQAIADKADVTLSDVVVKAVRDFIEANPVPAKVKKRTDSKG